ncbi:YoaK family protein [Myroides fluvii]|uniref:YoaK family protein n=1 Tax=Myroides fluvii TaxID=2572594 RepID=UPI00131BE32E|nr:YoaK family protein [Myroides fluvii]
MLRHQGKNRAYSHNLKLASVLSCVAGIVNSVGVLGLHTLTTNVTGHFAFFAEEIVEENYNRGIVYLFYTFFFLLGSFVSSLIMEWVLKHKPEVSYVIPILLEVLLLVGLSLVDIAFPNALLKYSAFTALVLLFSMGVQNSLVTRVSSAVVRTTHLTGLFTDLGIVLSQLFFYKNRSERIRLFRSIFLMLAIISCFFIGCVAGGFLYLHFQFKTLFLGAALLLFALWYDQLLMSYYSLKRKIQKVEIFNR